MDKVRGAQRPRGNQASDISVSPATDSVNPNVQFSSRTTDDAFDALQHARREYDAANKAYNDALRAYEADPEFEKMLQPDLQDDAVFVENWLGRQFSERRSFVPVDERDKTYFDNIDKHKDINVEQTMKSDVLRTHNGGIDANAILAAVRNNPATDVVDGSYAAYCYDIDAYVELTNDGVTHSFRRSAGQNKTITPSGTTLRNARAAVLLPQLLANAVEVNRSTKYKTENRPYGHVLMAVFSETDAQGNTEYYSVRMVVEHNASKKGYKLFEYGVVGRIHSTNAKKCTRTTFLSALKVHRGLFRRVHL